MYFKNIFKIHGLTLLKIDTGCKPEILNTDFTFFLKVFIDEEESNAKITPVTNRKIQMQTLFSF